jgi:hypothetical protein
MHLAGPNMLSLDLFWAGIRHKVCYQASRPNFPNIHATKFERILSNYAAYY